MGPGEYLDGRYTSEAEVGGLKSIISPPVRVLLWQPSSGSPAVWEAGYSALYLHRGSKGGSLRGSALERRKLLILHLISQVYGQRSCQDKVSRKGCRIGVGAN
jgi:hypothetical protein